MVLFFENTGLGQSPFGQQPPYGGGAGMSLGAGAWNGGGGQSTSNPIPGMHGLNIGALPVNPALMAALNQVMILHNSVKYYTKSKLKQIRSI